MLEASVEPTMGVHGEVDWAMNVPCVTQEAPM